MARREAPLVEEPVEVLSGHGLHRPDEVAGLDRLEREPMQAVPQRVEERGVSELLAQHVQDERASRIGVRVEHVARPIVPIGHDWADVAGPRLAEVRVQLALEVGRAFVIAPVVAEVKSATGSRSRTSG